MSLAVSPAPLQNGHTEINEEMDGGKVTSILKGQNGKSARRIHARKSQVSRRERGTAKEKQKLERI